MSNKKASRLDRVERAISEIARLLEAQGNAINYMLTEINNLKVKNTEVVDEEVVEDKDDIIL